VDGAALACLTLVTVLVAWWRVDFSVPPFEDAAILMRYSAHVAEGHGVVWNIGEPPVDGATDFLFMLLVALTHRAGLSLETSVRVLTASAHFLTVVAIYLGLRRVQGAGVVPSCLSAVYVAVGPGLSLVAAYFGTPVFVLSVVITALLAQMIMLRPADGSGRLSVWFALSSLVTGLIRPEGVLISLFILAGLGSVLPAQRSRAVVSRFLVVFLPLGGAYFAWRWQYFGYPLPNPFYKKGFGVPPIAALRSSVEHGLRFTGVFLPFFALCLTDPRQFRRGVALLLPIAGTIGMWAVLSDEMNFAGRFQYPALALAALAWFPIAEPWLRRIDAALTTRASRSAAMLAVLLLFAVVLERHVIASSATSRADGPYAVAKVLRPFADRGYTIATTEAGLLPLYSQWRAVDTWGLNDPWIAHHGEITDAYLRQQRPDVVMWHGYFSPAQALAPHLAPTPWSSHVNVVRGFVERDGYTLIAVFGVAPDDTHYYYVRTDLPDADAITRAIRAVDYRWSDGRPTRNYAQAGSR